MPKPSTLALRRLNRKHRVQHHGETCYADSTPDGTIIDTFDQWTRQHCPFTLERFLPAHRPPSNPPTLMANPVQPPTWEVMENFASLEKALPAAVKARKERFKGQVLRVRDRRTGDILMADLLGD